MSTLAELDRSVRAWAPSPGTSRDLFAESEERVEASLDVLSDLYNYNHWLFNKVRPFIRGRVCEVGCGTGNITQFLLNMPEVVGIEPSSKPLERVRARFAHHLNLRFTACPLNECPNPDVPTGEFDTVVCMNVLEHIEDDVDALDRMRRLCSSRGRVVILVPAHMCIFGQLDRAVGHHRRYNRRSLQQVFERAGLRTTYSFYLNALGFFGWGLHSRILKRDQIAVDSGRLFNRLVPFLDAAERVIPPPFGQSVVTVGVPA